MKIPVHVLVAVTATVLAATSPAEDASAGCKCEMMKKRDSAPAAGAQVPAAQVELNRLVIEMNSNIGPKKLEAMTAIITRLVEQANAKAAVSAPTAPSEAAKEEPHHH
jgi:hypothetical protein